jgi:energy-coupling factor transport system permease protein
MAQRKLSFYVERQSPVHRMSPLTKLVMVFSLIILGFFAPGFWLPLLLFIFVILPLAFLSKLAREYLLAFLRLLLPVVGFMFVMQSIFLPLGEEVLFGFSFLTVTRESITEAFHKSSQIMLMVASFILFLLTTHPSTLMTDLRIRGLPGPLAYVISSTLQILPITQNKAMTIVDAQRSRGLETEGSFRKRVGALLPLVGPLVFGSLVDVEERAIAIEARGFNSPVKKTSLLDTSDTRFEIWLRRAAVVIVVLAVGSRLWLS